MGIVTSRSNLGLAPKTGPQAKVYIGAIHRASGGAKRWSGNSGDTRRPASSGLRWRRLKAARRFVSYRVDMGYMPTSPRNGVETRRGIHGLTGKAQTRQPARVGKHKGGNCAGMAVDAARGLYQQRACKPDAGGGCVVGAFRPVGIRCSYTARAGERAGQELSYGGRGHAGGGSVHGAGQTEQRDCGAGDGPPERQTGRDTMSADKRTVRNRGRAAESRSSSCERTRATANDLKQGHAGS